MCFIFTSKGGSQDETLFNFVNNFENTNDCRLYLDYSKSSHHAFYSTLFNEQGERSFCRDIFNYKYYSEFYSVFLGGYLGDNYNRKKTVNYIHFLYAICLIILSITVTMDGTGLVIFCIAIFVFQLLFAASEPIFEAAIMDAIYEDVRAYVYQLNYWMFNIGTAIGMALGALLYLGHKHLLFILFFVAMLVSWYLFEKYYDVKQVISKKGDVTTKFKHFLKAIEM